MKRIIGIISSIFLVLTSHTLTANTNEDMNYFTNADEPSSVINVVTTLSIISDWAGQIGDSLFTPISVVTGSEDPHTYSLTSGEILMIGESDLFIRFGLPGLEPWVQSVLDAFPSLNVLSLASEEMMIIDPVTGVLNEHLWMSPIIVKSFVSNITTSIISLDFVNRNSYESNRDSYLSELDELIFDIED
ncbi:MAG: zinc ABC transporter substrate-binding protein, partial [Candidatus Heimdallarchaeota archaeon]|nr:zinc ABC transporter substrate-binding protein [Candidatus Heimdallarchaeota archaeon]